MSYAQNLDGAFEQSIGADGAEESVYRDALGKTARAVATLRARRDDNSLPILSIGEREDDLAQIETTERRIAHFKNFVVIGMGGSSYGGKALCALAHNPFANGPSAHGQATAVHFIDNIDPLTSDHALLCLDLQSTIFALVSKSGDTAETLAHALILVQETLSRLGRDAVREHFIAITEPKDSALTRMANAYGMTVLDHDTHTGGRFSALTNVGLLPARVAGLNIRAIRAGAATVVRHTFEVAESEPAKGAALHMALHARGRTLAVLMPYCDRLDAFNTWYRQLWAESLGKGGKGTTPLRSLGACDQHSQLQLYLDGPRDKFFTLILLAGAPARPAALRSPNRPSRRWPICADRTLGDLMAAEQRATVEVLIAQPLVRCASS